jgi:hypothetical protein
MDSPTMNLEKCVLTRPTGEPFISNSRAGAMEIIIYLIIGFLK